MGFMVVPTIASVSEDAMSAVPASLREGAYGLGASKLQVSTARRVPGRAVGHRGRGRARRLARGRRDDDRAGRRRPGADAHRRPARADVHDDLLHRARPPRATSPPAASQYKTIFAVGMLLFVITLVMNLISIRFVRKYRQVYE